MVLVLGEQKLASRKISISETFSEDDENFQRWIISNVLPQTNLHLQLLYKILKKASFFFTISLFNGSVYGRVQGITLKYCKILVDAIQ